MNRNCMEILYMIQDKSVLIHNEIKSILNAQNNMATFGI
jgi:hypothetical protein